MTESLDNILSGREPVAETNTTAVEEIVTQAAPTEPEAEGQTESQTEGEGERGQRMVPHEALHAEKQKVKRYTEQVAEFQKQLSETNAAWERRMAELVEAVKPKQEVQQPDWFADPDAVLNQRLGQTLSPITNDITSVRAELIELKAIQKYGDEKVSAVKAYLDDAAKKNDPELQTLGAAMRASSDPMKIAIDWFEKRTFDPAAERERIRAELLAELKPQGEQQAQPAAVMPSNLVGARNVGARTGPAWAGPQPIADIFSR